MADQADAQAILRIINCAWCQFPIGLTRVGFLALALDAINQKPMPTDAQSLLKEIKCFECIPPGLVDYCLLAALIDVANGKTVPSDLNQLMSEANCLLCIPPGMVPYALLAAAANM